MAESSAREAILRQVHCGKLLQLATQTAHGPRLCQVWYAAEPDGSRLFFISRVDRHHSRDLEVDDRVAGAIVAMDLDGPGQAIQGVTLTGAARRAQSHEVADVHAAYLAKWPRARANWPLDRVAAETSLVQMYVVRVIEYVLFDEINFRGDPRQTWRLDDPPHGDRSRPIV